MSWDATWNEYVRDGVVSNSAVMLIHSFLLKTYAASGANDRMGNSSDEEQEDHAADIPLAALKAETFARAMDPEGKDWNDEKSAKYIEK